MKSEFANSFLRDVRKLPDDRVRVQVRDAILKVEAARDLRSVPNLKKLVGGGPYYRIRIGDFRIGLRVDGDLVRFIRVMPRKEIYRYFP